MINAILKPVKYYNKVKKKFNRRYNVQWKKIAGPDYLGNCSLLFQNFYNEWKSLGNTGYPLPQEFANYYFTHYNPNSQYDDIKKPDSRGFGRSVQDIVELARYYQAQCDPNIPLEDYFDDCVNHAIVETTNGQLREMILIEEYEKRGFNAVHTSGVWDLEFGVDFIIKKGNVIKDYIQCKPISTFIGNYNLSLIQDRRNFFKKEQAKLNYCMQNDIAYYPTKFIIYDTNHVGEWCYIGNKKKGMLLNELCNKNGFALHERRDFTMSE